MSAPATAPTPRLPLCSTNARLLDLLFRPCRGYAPVVCGRGQGAQQHMIQAGEPIDFLPPWLHRELEFDPPGDVRIGLTTADRAGNLLDVSAVSVELLLEPVFEKGHAGQGWTWAIPADVEAAAWSRLDGFGVAPAIVVDQGWSLLALWPLETPAPVETDRARVEHLQHALAIAVGGRTDDVDVVVPVSAISTEPTPYNTISAVSLARPVLRIPGSRNHDRAEGVLVQFARFGERRFALEDLARACTPPAPRVKKTKEPTHD